MKRQKKVLLVEDDLPLARMYQVVLKAANLVVDTAMDGEEALVKAGDGPDLILLDIILPKKDGFEVLVELKKTEGLRDIPVVCLTVLHQQEDIDKCKRLGAVDFLIKTELTPEEVVKRVLSYF